MENLDNFKASAAFADGEMTASLFSLYIYKEADHSDPITPRELRQAILFGDMPTQNGCIARGWVIIRRVLFVFFLFCLMLLKKHSDKIRERFPRLFGGFR